MKTEVVRLSAQETINIRHLVLWPDKPPDFCALEDDELGLHFGMKVNSELVCVASLLWLGNDVRLRKFATLQAYQGQGIGSQLLVFMLNEMKNKNAVVFFCDARTTAETFYNKFGLQKSGEPFDKSGVKYYKMACDLHQSSNQ